MSHPTTSASTPGRKYRFAIEQFEGTVWTGGVVYIQNLLHAISLLDPSERPYTVMFYRRGDKPCSTLADKQVEVPPEPKGIGTRIYQKIAGKIGTRIAPPPKIAPFVAAEKVDALFTCNRYPPSIKVPLMGWIPDFQYRHLSKIVGPDFVKMSDGLNAAMIKQSKALIFSSNDVLKDLKNFFPEAAPRSQVVHFVSQIPADVYNSDPAIVCPRYSIPQRFFYLPNQFWEHKNHLLVIKALQILSKRSVDITVVCTGSSYDFRNPAFFSSLLTEIALAGVHDRFRILGLVPRADVFRLERQAMAILQPSLFEGWSTSIEEAKSLGKRVIASDLDVHKEQVPGADFFPRHDAEKLADCLQAVAEQAPAGPDLQREDQARAELPERSRAFARKFLEAMQRAASAGST